MSKERQVKQVVALKAHQQSLMAFFGTIKELLNEDPNDPVTLEMADLHDKSSIEFLKSVQTLLKGANRNFLKVVTDENDPV